MRERFWRWVTFGVVCLGVAGAMGQAPEGQGTATLHVETKLVSLDVVVTDAHGKPVPGLTRDDFTVLEDGKPQKIRNFDGWEKRGPASATVDRYGRTDWGDAPLAILVLDQISTQFVDGAYAAQMLERYLKAQPAVLPVPTMLLLVTDRGYQTLAEFTRDRAVLMAAMKKRPPVLPGALARGDSDQILGQTFEVLQQIALAEAGQKQHKSVIWVGSGFPGIDPTALDDASQALLQSEIRKTVDLLMDTHTTVYKIDPVGVDPAPPVDIQATLDAGGSLSDIPMSGEDPFEDNFNFNTFAVATGGQYFYGQNDLDRYFQLSLEQTNEFYTLTYRPPETDGTEPETFRKISVRVNRPGLKVVTRQGFYSNEAPEAAPTTKELGASLGAVARGDMEFTGVGVKVKKVEPGKTPGTVYVTYQMESKSLTWTDAPNGGVSSAVTTVLVDLDAQRQIVGSRAYLLHPSLAAAHAAERFNGTLIARDEANVTAKTASLRLIVRDASGRIGTAMIPGEDLRGAVAK